jgi:hypothetical protein
MSERPPPPPTEYFFERFPWNNRWILFGVALVVSCFDYLAGPIVFFPILFVVPVALMAWNCGLRTALILGAILCVIRFSIQYAWGIPYTLPVYATSKRSRFITLVHAATKSWTNFFCASAQP